MSLTQDWWVGLPLGGDEVHGESQGSPEGDDDGEHAEPNGDDGDDDEGGCGDGSHDVGPHSRDVQHLHEEGQPGLVQGAVGLVEHDLEVTLHQPNCDRQASTHCLIYGYLPHTY